VTLDNRASVKARKDSEPPYYAVEMSLAEMRYVLAVIPPEYGLLVDELERIIEYAERTHAR
jgi:hypothetical protein